MQCATTRSGREPGIEIFLYEVLVKNCICPVHKLHVCLKIMADFISTVDMY